MGRSGRIGLAHRLAYGLAHRRPRVLLVLAALVPALAFAGCGSDAASYPPTGIDELTVPTPSLDPTDFVGSVTNPWLPLTRGTRWTYRVTTQATGGTGPLTVTVETAPVTVDGVRATAVVSDGADLQATDYFAQDRSGNVWWLGREGSWQAGADGARAGLAMPAVPRLGDGWAEGYRKGVFEDHAQVVSTEDAFRVGDRSFTGVLDLLTSSPLDPGVAREASYVARVGLVRSYSVTGLARLVELVSGPTKPAAP